MPAVMGICIGAGWTASVEIAHGQAHPPHLIHHLQTVTVWAWVLWDACSQHRPGKGQKKSYTYTLSARRLGKGTGCGGFLTGFGVIRG